LVWVSVLELDLDYFFSISLAMFFASVLVQYYLRLGETPLDLLKIVEGTNQKAAEEMRIKLTETIGTLLTLATHPSPATHA
jgi:hypothetical protein